MALGTLTQLNLNPALSAAEPGEEVFGGLRVRSYQFAAESSYVVGGTSLSAAALGFPNAVLAVLVQIVGSSGANDGAVEASYNLSTGKVQMFVTSGTSPVGLQEAAAAANLSGLTLQVIAFGY